MSSVFRRSRTFIKQFETSVNVAAKYDDSGRLNSVTVRHIHQDLLDRIDMDAIMRDFVSRSEIRKNIFGNILA